MAMWLFLKLQQWTGDASGQKGSETHLIIESDSQDAVDLINNKMGSRSKIFQVITEV